MLFFQAAKVNLSMAKIDNLVLTVNDDGIRHPQI